MRKTLLWMALCAPVTALADPLECDTGVAGEVGRWQIEDTVDQIDYDNERINNLAVLRNFDKIEAVARQQALSGDELLVCFRTRGGLGGIVRAAPATPQ